MLGVAKHESTGLMHVEGPLVVAWKHVPTSVVVIAIVRAIGVLRPVGALADIVLFTAALALRVEAELALRDATILGASLTGILRDRV